MAIAKVAAKSANLTSGASIAVRQRSKTVIVRKSIDPVPANAEAARPSKLTYIPNSDAGIRLLDTLERIALRIENDGAAAAAPEVSIAMHSERLEVPTTLQEGASRWPVAPGRVTNPQMKR